MPSTGRFWRWRLFLAGFPLILVILATAFLIGYGVADEPSRATYDRIKMGKTRQGAETILGDWPRQLVREHRGSVTVGWEAPDGAMIEVDFDPRGRVTGKHFAESDGSSITA